MNPRTLLAAALLVCAGCSRSAEIPPPEVAQPRLTGIDPDAAAAWKSRGFEAGWIAEVPVPHHPMPVVFISERNERELDQVSDVVPAFRIVVNDTVPILKGLPAIGRPFGLVLSVRGDVPPGDAIQMDKVLKAVGGVHNLTVLLVETSNVTDEGVKELATLQSLKALRLGPCKVTETGLKHLAGLKNLRNLNVFNSPVTDEGLEILAALSLTSLDLGGTLVTDEGLKHLTGHKNLTRLSLTRVPTVTDAGLEHLALLKNLTDLDISFTQVTDAGAERLREQLPGCRVFLKN